MLTLTLALTLTLNLALALTLTLSERNALLWRPVNYNLARFVNVAVATVLYYFYSLKNRFFTKTGKQEKSQPTIDCYLSCSLSH